MKKIILVGALMLGVVCASAQLSTYSTTISEATNTVFFTNAVTMHSVTIINGAEAPLTLRVYDDYRTNLYWTNAAYVTTAQYMTNYTNIYTNYVTGAITNTNTYTAIYSYYTTNAAATNTISPTAVWLIPTNTTFTFTPITPVRFHRGIVVSNDVTNVSITATYQPSR